MAKMVEHRKKDSIHLVTSDIVERYQLNTTQQKEMTNRVIAMKAMRHWIYNRIRRLLPVQQTPETVA